MHLNVIPSEAMEDDGARLDALARTLGRELAGGGASRTPCPKRFVLEAEWAGNALRVMPRVWSGGEVAYARIVRLDAGASAQAISVVFVPTRESTRPILCAEILCFKKGLHMFAMDLFSTQPGDHLGAARASLLESRVRLERAFELLPVPEWGADAFSQDMILLKPGARADLDASDPARELRRVALTWANASTAEDSDVTYALARRGTFLQTQGSAEPAGPFLSRIAGEEWTEDFTHELLYPRWLRHRDSPPWDTPKQEEVI